MGIKRGRAPGRQLGEMHEKGSASSRRGKDISPLQRWWTLPEAQMPGALVSTLRYIQQQQQQFEWQRQVCGRLYGGLVPGSAYGSSYNRMQTLHPSLSGRLTYNLMAIVIDTIVSKITKENISTQFLTTGGNYRQQRRAKKLSQFADGVTYETGMDAQGADAFRDGLVQNEGITKTYEDWRTGRVVSERVIPSELYVDEVDGLYRKPQQMHHVRTIDREVLLESEWAKGDKKVREAIKKCHIANKDELGGTHTVIADEIAVGESWRLPTGVDPETGELTEDGKHVIYIDNCVLNPPDEREWKKDRFPFSVYRWKTALYGWHGLSLASDLIGSQVEMNHLLIMFQRAFRLMAAFRIAVEQGTIPDQHFTDKIGTILHVPRGAQMPQFLTPPALNQQYFQHFDAIRARAFEMARVSQLSAVGVKPAGLDSGEAQRVYHDIEAEGFSTPAKAYEDYRLDVVKLQIDVVRDIQKRDGKYEVRAPVSSQSLAGQRFLRSVDWKNVKMDEKDYILRGYSTSSLPNTPSGRLATVQDLMRAGIVDIETGRKLLNFPDLAQVQNLLGAAEDWIMSCLDDIVESDKMRRPDPYMLLPMAEKLGIQEYSLGAANGMEDSKLDKLRTWIKLTQEMKKKASKQQLAEQLEIQQAMAAAAPGAVQGQGAAAPVSPMLPPGMKAAA